MQIRDAMLQQIANKDIEFGIGGEWIVDDVQVGENIIPLNDPNDPFWILLVTKCVYVIEESLINGWNNKYERCCHMWFLV